MANTFDVHIVTLPIGAYIGAVARPFAKLPDNGQGGITILEANLLSPGGTAATAGTIVTGVLITMTDVGTPVANGTIGAFATPLTPTGTVPAELTISDGYVAAGEWIGFDQASGTVPAGCFVSLSYIMGKA
jgi:hypothetical protein